MNTNSNSVSNINNNNNNNVVTNNNNNVVVSNSGGSSGGELPLLFPPILSPRPCRHPNPPLPSHYCDLSLPSMTSSGDGVEFNFGPPSSGANELEWLRDSSPCQWSDATTEFSTEGPLPVTSINFNNQWGKREVFRLQRCQSEADHWCCDSGMRYGACVPSDSKYLCHNP